MIARHLTTKPLLRHFQNASLLEISLAVSLSVLPPHASLVTAINIHAAFGTTAAVGVSKAA